MSADLQKLLPEVYKTALGFIEDLGRGKVPRDKEKARALLGDGNSTGVAVYGSAVALVGSDAFRAWEPESIWLELHDQGAELPIENRDKLQAAITMALGNAVYWDALLFENIVVALNDNPMDPAAIQEASPGEIAWGVFEIEILEKGFGSNEAYDHEPTRYTALSMYRSGLILAPELLVFSQEELDKLTHGTELARQVSESWGAIPKDQLEEATFEETPVGVQLAKLAAIHLYVGERSRRLVREIGDLA